MILGCHVQMKAPEYVLGSVKEALSYDANALMLYTGAPQNTKRTPTDRLLCSEARQMMADHGLDMKNMIIHAPYIINPANSVKPEVAELAREFLAQEIERTAAIGAAYLVLHPGSYTTADLETGIATIAEQLNTIEDYHGVTICLETMAGKGSEVGYRFEHLAEIMEKMRFQENYGVCLDTCHISDAGYDVKDFDSVLDEFDRVIGLDRLHVIHLNDSKNERGARKDRHANLGMGTIGFETLHAIAANERVSHIPKILETPYINKKPPYRYEIAMLRSGVYDSSVLENL